MFLRDVLNSAPNLSLNVPLNKVLIKKMSILDTELELGRYYYMGRRCQRGGSVKVNYLVFL